jgi:hypothetical protein
VMRILTYSGNAPTSKHLGPDLSKIVERDAGHDIQANRMMLPPANENRSHAGNPEGYVASRKEQREVSKAPLEFPNEFLHKSKSPQAPKGAPAWTSESRIQEIKRSGSASLQRRREKWETAWQERSKAWFHAHGPMSESKQRATSARQEQEWERIALLSEDDDASERLEYIQDTKILLSRPPYFGLGGQHAPGTDAPPVYRPSPAEEKIRRRQFHSLWKEEQALSGVHRGTPAENSEELRQKWERVANLPPGEFSSAMYDYRRKNDRLPWAEQRTRPMDEQPSPNPVDELRHVGKSSREQPMPVKQSPESQPVHQSRTKGSERKINYGLPTDKLPKTDEPKDGARDTRDPFGDGQFKPEADLPDDHPSDQPDDVMAQKAAAKEKYRRLQREQQSDPLQDPKPGDNDVKSECICCRL